MPYKDPIAQAVYQSEWKARRRAEWFEGKVCVDCGAVDDLQLDHVDPKLKVSHKIWSWSQKRREAELAKCVVRCDPCHRKKTNADRAREGSYLSDEQVESLRQRWANGERQIDLAREFGISKQYVYTIVRGLTRDLGSRPCSSTVEQLPVEEKVAGSNPVWVAGERRDCFGMQTFPSLAE